jgi:hypothetical protein
MAVRSISATCHLREADPAGDPVLGAIFEASEPDDLPVRAEGARRAAVRIGSVFSTREPAVVVAMSSLRGVRPSSPASPLSSYPGPTILPHLSRGSRGEDVADARQVEDALNRT